jgi:hypothetical protein
MSWSGETRGRRDRWNTPMSVARGAARIGAASGKNAPNGCTRRLAALAPVRGAGGCAARRPAGRAGADQTSADRGRRPRGGRIAMTHPTRRGLLAAGAAALGLAALGCAGAAGPAPPAASRASSGLFAVPARGEWPAAVRAGGPAVLAAYQFAAERPELLKYMPCFCGCGAEGLAHRSNLECFVDGPPVRAWRSTRTGSAAGPASRSRSRRRGWPSRGSGRPRSGPRSTPGGPGAVRRPTPLGRQPDRYPGSPRTSAIARKTTASPSRPFTRAA